MTKRKSNDVATGAEVVVNGSTVTIKQRGTEKQQNGNPSRNAKTQQKSADANGHVAKRQRLEDRTDYTRWRMRDDESRHTWHYLEDDDATKEWPQTLADKYYLGLPLVRTLLPHSR
jgi:lanosterol synthase